MFQIVGGREINITEEQKLILCHVSTRTNQVYMNAARMRQSQLPLPPSLHPSIPPSLISAAKPNAVALIWGICLLCEK